MTALAVPGRTSSSRAAGAIAAAVVLAVGITTVVHLRSGGSSATPLTPAAIAAAQTPAQRLAAAQLDAASRATDPKAWRTLGGLATSEAITSGDPALYAVAQDALGEAASLAPGDQPTIVLQGVLALSLHDFAKAHELGLAARAIDPIDAEAIGVVVDAAVELGHYDEAAAAAQEMLDHRPGAPALARASYLRELHGDLPGAIAAMQQAVSAAGASAGEESSVRTFLGDLDLAGGRPADALASYQRALTLVSTSFNAAIGHARALAATGRLADAITELTSVADRSPVPGVAIALGDLRTAAGDADGAAKAYALVRADQRLLAAAGAAVDLEVAAFAADHDPAAQAVTLARTAYGVRSTVFTADALGWALTKAGQPKVALPYVEQSLALGTRSVPMRLHAAQTYAAVGDLARARDQLTIAFTGSPWLAPLLRADAVALAGRLGVTVPQPWSA